MTIPHTWYTIPGFRTLTRHKSRNKNISSPVITPPVITPPVVVTPPSAPTINTIVPSYTQLQVVDFSAPTNNGGAPIINYQYSLNNGSYINANVTSSPITITGLTNGTSYSVKIRAVNSAGPGEASIAVTMSTLLVTPPSAPTITTIAPSYTQLQVEFSAPTNNGGAPITSYQYSLNNGSYIDANVTSSPLTITDLTNGTSYSVKIRAVNSAGPGEASIAVTMSTFVATPPSAPVITGLQYEANKKLVYFTPPANDGGSPITQYLVSSNKITAFTQPFFQPYNSLLSPMSFEFSTDMDQDFLIKAVNSAGLEGPQSNIISTRNGTVSTPVVAPTINNIVPTSNALQVNFSAPINGGAPITNYQYSLNDGSYINANVTSSPITITGLINGTPYSVKIRAVNSVGPGEASNIMTSTPVVTPPSAPTINTIVPTTNALQVNFSAPLDNGGASITSYQYSLNNDSYINASVTSSPITITGLINGTSYSVKLRAVNSAGAGEASNIMTSTPVVTPPSAPTINNIVPTSNALQVNFSIPLNNGGALITKYQYSLNNGNYVDANVTSSSITIIGLINGTSYSVKIRAVNSAGAGEASNIMTSTPVSGPFIPAFL